MPQAIKNVETIEGDGGLGTIKKLNITEGTEVKYLKHRIDALDRENDIIIEGDGMDKIESISYEMKFEASPDGGCKGTNGSKYHPIPGSEIDEEKLKERRARAVVIYKAVEAYILANPDG